MKKVTFILLLGIAVAAIATNTTLKWKTTSIDLGQVTKNESKHLTFEFTNTSNQAITILEAKGSCGCTNVTYPQSAIQPNETAVIKANFKSGKVGAFRKNIRIKTSDTEDLTYLYFKGEVVE